MDLKSKIAQIKTDFDEAIKKVKDASELENLRIKFLSRQGLIHELMSSLKDLTPEQKKETGSLLNSLKTESEKNYNEKKEELDRLTLSQSTNKLQSFDVTAYKPGQLHGHLHPYTHVLEKLENIFISMGYQIADGPELEDDKHNFASLNIPADHPARDMQDTFWLTLPGKLMRTQTSSVQIRVMENNKPPFAILSTGRCYRNEAVDASHDFVFAQAEGLMVDKNISMANLFATLKIVLQQLFERDDIEIRIRPGYFPFVEPGVEVDILCPFCQDGCSVCKRSRWLEIAGAGLVHPNVLKACGIDSTRYSGFAFGIGLTRLVMLKYGINDIRLLTSSRIDFLEQFN